MKREQWKSRLGFIWAAVGSAVGLGNIWRFPYVVGENGGAAFVLIYLLCLGIIGLPVLISEIAIGRKTQKSPASAFHMLGRRLIFRKLGGLTIVTGFIVSCFYGVIVGWTLGYLIETVLGHTTNFTSSGEALAHFQRSVSSPLYSISMLALFMFLCFGILTFGVRKGIEASNKVFMPLLLIVLVGLAIKGVTLDRAAEGLNFLFRPDFSQITPKVVLMALGQAFFALSLGQGTMVTYGSYLSKKENIPTTCFPIAFFGTMVSLLAGIAIFTIVFSSGLSPTSGEGLMFQTLPLVFSSMPGGIVFALLFFLLIFLAGLTSQISALEPTISYLIDERGWARKKATGLTIFASFALGVPCALSFGPLKSVNFKGMTLYSFVSNTAVNLLIPIGGLLAVYLVGWRWGMKDAEAHLSEGAEAFFSKRLIFKHYLRIGIKFIAPLIITIILIDSII